MVNIWVLKANPDIYPILKAARDPELHGRDFWWAKHDSGIAVGNTRNLKRGDLLLFWVTKENQGIVGFGIVIAEAQERIVHEVYYRYSKQAPPKDWRKKTFEVVEISYEKIFDERITRERLLSDPNYSEELDKILFRLEGSFFKIPSKEWDFLKSYLLIALIQKKYRRFF